MGFPGGQTAADAAPITRQEAGQVFCEWQASPLQVRCEWESIGHPEPWG